MRVRLTRLASNDVDLAFQRYARIDPELGDQFLDGLDAVIELIQMFPDGPPPVEGFDGLRRARMRRFPYGVFYQHIAGTELILVRVLHSRSDHPLALEHPGP